MSQILDETDRQIIGLLQQDGRASNVDVARQLGIAEATVRKRLERLLGSGFIRITAVVNPATLGLTTQLFVGIEAELSKMEDVAARLAGIPEVYSVRLVTGTYDVIVEAFLPSGDQLLSFLVDKVATIPGVKRTETCHVLKAVRWGCDWAVPTGSESKLERQVGLLAGSDVIPGRIVVPG